MILREDGLFPFFQEVDIKIGHPGRAIRAAGGLFPFFQGSVWGR